MMNPTMLAGLALAGLAAYGMPGLSAAPQKSGKISPTWMIQYATQRTQSGPRWITPMKSFNRKSDAMRDFEMMKREYRSTDRRVVRREGRDMKVVAVYRPAR